MTKKIILLIIGGFLLTSSLVTGLFLVKQQQETRREAAGCETGWSCGSKNCDSGCELECLPSEECHAQGEQLCRCKSTSGGGDDSPDCGDSQCESGGTCYDDGYCCATNQENGLDYECDNGTWVRADGGGDGGSGEGGCDGDEGTLGAGCCEDVNDDHLYCNNGLECCQGSCHNPDDPECDAEGTSCSGTCDRHGCSNDCPNRWPVSFYCRGRSHSACGDQHGTFLGSGVPAGSIKYGENVTVKKDGNETTISSWCTTVQADSNAPDGEAIVVFIGDHGDYCVEGTGCNPDNLDWDCTRPTNTPTPTPTPDYDCNCLQLRMYDQEWNLITDYGQLEPGDQVYLLVTGETGHPSGITKARFRVNTQAWQESEQRHQGNFYWNFEIPDYGDYSVEAEVYNPALGWN